MPLELFQRLHRDESEHLTKLQRRVCSYLEEAQRLEWPDSRFLTLRSVLETWLPSAQPEHTLTFEAWIEKAENRKKSLSDALTYNALIAFEKYREYRVAVRAEFRERVMNSLIMCLQYPAVVFYECNQLEPGVYRWRGARYGIQGHEYISGFSEL